MHGLSSFLRRHQINERQQTKIAMQSQERSLLSIPESLALSFSDRRLKAIRREVTKIMREILPEEVEHVDAMFEDYAGREDQLLKSVKKMQEAHRTHVGVDEERCGPVDPDDFILDDDEEDGEGGLDAMMEEGGWNSEGSSGGDSGRFDVDRWQEDLENQIDSSRSSRGSGGDSHRGPYNPLDTLQSSVGNPQSGGVLKSSPELMVENNSSSMTNGRREHSAAYTEEKKNDSPLQNSNNFLHDPDENDLPPEVVGTSLGNFRNVSGLTMFTASELSSSGVTTDEVSVPSVGDSDAASDISPAHLSIPMRTGEGGENGGNGRAARALVRMRVWDPATPRVQWRCEASAAVALQACPRKGTGTASTDGGPGGEELKREDTPDPRSLSRPRGEEKRLSTVREEPEKPPHRGESYFDDGDANVLKNACLAAVRDEVGERERLEAGALVGMRLRPLAATQQLSGEVSAASATSFSPRREFEWKAGQEVYVCRANFLPLSKLSELHFRIETDHASLRELVMDGLPPQSLALEEAELIFEALGSNASIRRLSMRYSNVDDDLASLLALALVDNVTLTQLSLVGNSLTNVSAKNFYSVLKKNNETLRMLDLNGNPDIEKDVEQALEQFMGQRELKRTLTNKAEKARRAARGMPPDENLDDNGDEVPGDGQVTVVIPQDTLVKNCDGMELQYKRNDDHDINDDSSMTAKPRLGENFRDFMRRMDEAKESNLDSSSYNRQLMHQSYTEREAFDNFSGVGSFVEQGQQQQVPYPLVRKNKVVQEAPGEHSQPQIGSNESTGSSITTLTHTQSGNVEDVITTTSNRNDDPGSPLKPAGEQRTRASTPWRMNAIELQESAGDDRVTKSNRVNYLPRQIDTIEYRESFDHDARRFRPQGQIDTVEAQESADPTDRRILQNRALSNKNVQQSALPTQSGAVTYHPTQASEPSHSAASFSGASNPSLEISENDFIDAKARERDIRRMLATEAGAVGAYHINEAAPARQNRSSGRGGRRSRGGRTESQRMRRLRELEGSGDGGRSHCGMGTAALASTAGADDEVILDANIDRTDDLYLEEIGRKRMDRRRSSLSLHSIVEIDDCGIDRIVSGFVAVLLVGLLVMVIVLVIRYK